ncbi:MAG: hypothetical protein IK093_13890, partial [Ruminiclostridium sp.]|nr:hypothetical protein [Ruminiclostridium sp.]
MTTNNYGHAPAGDPVSALSASQAYSASQPSYSSVPTEQQLEQLANSLFPDFEADRCAGGIEKLATTGDPSVIYDAATKAESYSGYFGSAGGYEQQAESYAGYAQLADGFGGGYYSDYEALANELTNGYSAEPSFASPTAATGEAAPAQAKAQTNG